MSSPVEKVEIVSPPSYLGTMQPEVTKSANKRYVIAGVSAVLVVGMIIGGVLIGIYLQNKHTSETIKHIKEFVFDEKTKDGKTQKTTLKVDADKNEATEVKGDMQTHQDFDRGITTIRTHDNDGKLICFLEPMNKTGVTEPRAMKDYLDTLKTSDWKTEDEGANHDESETKMQPSSSPVDNINFLSEKAQIMCANLKTYWLVPATDNHRNKRATCLWRCYGVHWHCNYIRRRWFCTLHPPHCHLIRCV